MDAPGPVALVWFRRDLRLDDQPAVRAAAATGVPVACAFVLDPRVYAGDDAAPARVRFLLEGLHDLDARLRERGGGLLVRHGEGEAEVARLARELGATSVHACADLEPLALDRDRRAAAALAEAGAPLALHDDLTVAPPAARTRADGLPHRTYSGFARAALRALAERPAAPLAEHVHGRLRPAPAPAIPAPEGLGVRGGARYDLRGGETAGLARLRWWADEAVAAYAARRNDVADPDATSRLSAYLKLGMVSPRRAFAVAERAGAAKWRAELLWRDWFKDVLRRHPDMADRPVDRRYEAIPAPGSDAAFDAWRAGETGFGLVDAGMRQLAETGFQPNRIRMVCASFLVKDLHVDWRRGERHYRSHLVDGDLAANAGGWQWTAGVGLDAAPYFRVLNPLLQEARFDPDGAYVRRWAPDRPPPIVDHAAERRVALDLYRGAVGDVPPAGVGGRRSGR